MTRRRFLSLLLLFLGALSVYLVSPARVRSLKRRIRRYKLPRLDPRSPTGTLSEPEMRTVLALAEVLLPRDRPGMDREFFLQHVYGRTSDTRGYLREYREAVKLLDEKTPGAAGRPDFAGLGLAEREKVLASILWKYRAGESLKARLALIFAPGRTLAFREFVVKDLLAAYYRSPAAWSLLGYAHFPGTPAADPLEYTRPLKSPAA